MKYPWRTSYDPWFPHHLTYFEGTMYDLLEKTATNREDKEAITYFKKRFSYAELMSEIERTARALKADGFKAQDVATLCLPNIPQTVILFYAVNKLGGICNMLHPLSPPAEIARNMKATKSRRLFILDAQLANFADDLAKQGIEHIVYCSAATYMDTLTAFFFRLTAARKIGRLPNGAPFQSYPDLLVQAAGQGLVTPHSRNARDGSVYLHSGGTTGEPKTIVLSDYNFNALAIQGPGILGMTPPNGDQDGQAHVAILPFFHGFGLGIGMHLLLTIGVRIILVPRFSPDALAEVIVKERPAILAGVPTLLEGMIRSKKLKKADLSCLTHVFVGGDTLNPETKQRFEAFIAARGAKLKIREGYGLTETVTVNAVNPENKNRDGAVGLPLSDMYIKILDLETGDELPAGQNGEICVTGPTMMVGYLNDPEATRNTMRIHEDGRTWVHTGDLGRLDEAGYVIFEQRLKRIIKVSGVPVFPSQIENLVSKIPGIVKAAAVARPHPYKIQVVVLFVVKEEGADEALLREKILALCKQELIHYATPAEIVFRDRLPETLVGKIDVVKLEAELKEAPLEAH